MTEYQLRDYKLKDGEIDQFIEEWRTKVVPLRNKLGFRIVNSWLSRENNRFVWVVAWEGATSFEQAEEKYFASPERAALKPDPARHIEKADTIMVDSVAH